MARADTAPWTRLARALDGGAARAAVVGAYLFFAIGGTVTGKAARDALFLSRFTAPDLAAMDTITTLAIAAAVWVQLRLNARLATRVVLTSWPLGFAAGDVLVWVGLALGRPEALPLTFLWTGVQGCFGPAHAALLAARLLTAQEARRHCALVGGGAILGWMAGGWITSVVAVHAGATLLVPVDGLLTALCAALAWWSWPRRTPPAALPVRHRSVGLGRSAAAVWHSRHLRAIAAVAFLSAAVTTIAGLQFRAIASQSMHDPDQLAAFFGTFNVRAGLLALACQILVTARVLNRFGMGALAVAPSLVGIASLILWWSGSLAAATALKGADHTVRYSIHRSAVDLLYRPLSEGEVLEGKTVIDALVSRWGDTVGALMTLVGTAALHLSAPALTSISVVLVVPWLAAGIVAGREYRRRLAQALPEGGSRLIAGSTAAGARRDGLGDPDPAVRLATLRALTRSGTPRRRTPRVRRLAATVLDGELVALALLADAAERRAGDAAASRREAAAIVERIARLLFVIAPARYPAALIGAIDGDGLLDAAALDYLDVALDRDRRQLLQSAIDRWRRATARR